MFRAGKLRVFRQDLFGRCAGCLEKLCILKHICSLKIQNSALTDAEQISGASQPQIFSGNKEAVIGVVEYFQTFLCLFGF